MPSFVEFQLNAKLLTEKVAILSENIHSSLICFSLFQHADYVDDVVMIGAVAESLDENNDYELMRHLQRKKIHKLLTFQEFMDFKTHALIGCYLLKWRQHNSNKSLVALFQKDLKISSLNDLSDQYIDLCLLTLSQYCSFVYENKSKPVYAKLYNQLGDSIQVDIHSARYPTPNTTSLFYDVLSRTFSSGVTM